MSQDSRLGRPQAKPLMWRQNACCVSYMDKEEMTMVTPLDPSLDVSLRLANLRIWQRDFQQIDQKLEEQLHQLDGNNLLQLQQAVHISNLRRRMEMTLVRQPLSIPEGVLKNLGVEAVRSLLAQQFARLTREERLLWRMLLECGQTYVRGDNEEVLLMKLVLYFQKCGVELIVIDEVQHIKRPELKRRVLEVSNMARGIPMICASCHPIEWTEGDAEVKGRWNDFFELKQYTGTRLDDLLATVELFLPFSQDSHLVTRQIEGKPGKASLIEQWTGGILRDIMLLIRDACRRAIERNDARLHQEILETT